MIVAGNLTVVALAAVTGAVRFADATRDALGGAFTVE
jgi:hypothetical protein